MQVPVAVTLQNDFTDSQTFLSKRCDVYFPPAQAGAAGVDTKHMTRQETDTSNFNVPPTPQIDIQYRDLLKRKAEIRSIPLASRDGCADVVNTAILDTGLGMGFTTPSAMRRCLGSFPFRASRDLPVIDTVIRGLDTYYVYKQLAKDSPSPQLPSNLDVIAKLKYVRQYAVAGKIKTTYSFFQKIKSVVQSLNDGHTVFINYCMEQGSYLGLPVMGVVENGVQKVRVVPLKGTLIACDKLGRLVCVREIIHLRRKLGMA